jgi:phage-related protein
MPVTWKTSKRPFMPNPKTYSQAAPEDDSEYDFSEYNNDQRLHYFDRVFEGTITIVEKNMTQLNMLLTKVARWMFGGWKTLEFDDMPGTIWTAKIENFDQISFELGRVGIATVYFRVKPFSKWFLNSDSGGVPLDSNVFLDSNVKLDLDFNPTYSFESGNQTFEIENLGDWFTYPTILITGAFTELSIGINSKLYTYTGSIDIGDTLIIDCQNQMATKNGQNAMTGISGDRFELSPGINELSINSNGIGQATVTFDFKFINMAVI